MRKITLAILASIFLITSAIAAFDGTIIDMGQINTNPAIAVDSNGVQHLVWSRGNELVYANSQDNFVSETTIIDSLQSYSNPKIDIDSNNNVHVAFNAYGEAGSYYRTYYVNSINWSDVKNLGFGNNEEEIDLKISPTDDSVYIATQNNNNDYLDIVILHSTDYENFDSTYIGKNKHQMNPAIAINATGDVHLIYWDWSDGVANGAGLYKTRYRNSADGYISEETVSTANQSYGADIAVDSNNDVWVSFKDTTETIQEGEFDYGIVWITDRDSNWTKQQITPSMIHYIQERPTALSISGDNVKHLTWTNWEDSGLGNVTINVQYANSNNFSNVQVTDVGLEEGLGWVDIDTYNNEAYIAANIHSLGLYTPEEPEPFCRIMPFTRRKICLFLRF